MNFRSSNRRAACTVSLYCRENAYGLPVSKVRSKVVIGQSANEEGYRQVPDHCGAVA